MQPENSLGKLDKHYTFIEQARRKQIIEATIQVLAERGFINTSFAKIAEKAGINQSLISYHFKDKAELTDQVRQVIYQERFEHVSKAVAAAESSVRKLEAYIVADVTYMSEHPEFFRALVEVLFGQRDTNGMSQYMQDIDTPMFSLLQNILVVGQKNGEFAVFSPVAVAHIIDGAKDQFLAQVPFRPSLKSKIFTNTLLTMARQFVQQENL